MGATGTAPPGTPRCVVFCDFAKAYDRMDRPWMSAVMRRMGFPEPAVRWVKLMLSGTTAMVSLNGFYTPAFPLLRSVQQGSPLSTMLYAIAAQPLAAALRREAVLGRYRPLLLPGGVPAPISEQHADDLSIHVESPADAGIALAGPVQDFCAATNAQLSVPKCKGLLFGDQSSLDPVTRVCGVCGIFFPPPQDPIRHLGIFLAPMRQRRRTRPTGRCRRGWWAGQRCGRPTA